MKKEKKTYFYLLLFGIILILLGMKVGHLFGSNTDWFNQHTAFPEYFRNLFYETKQLFPSFAFQIGGGQNIFHFSYYGLLSPFVLLSYLFPFINMTTFLQIINICIILSSGLLCYYFLSTKKLKKNTCFLATLFFFCATPIIYQAHRHFMFMDYMPFLLLGLIAIDRYFESHKIALLPISIFLMIMTSYYYSIGGLFVLAIYYVYRYLQNNPFHVKRFFLDGIKFLVPYLLGIVLAGVLLLPTIYVVLNGRGTATNGLSWFQLLLPKLDYKTLLYDGYSMGLTVISLYALVHQLKGKKKHQRFLGISCLIVAIIPIFMYALNGALYIRSKALIPFLPLFIYCLALFLEYQTETKRKNQWLFFLPFILAIALCSILCYHHSSGLAAVLLIDITITCLALYLYQKHRNDKYLLIPLCFAIIVSIVANQSEDYVTYEKYRQVNDPFYQEALQKVTSQEDLARTKLLKNGLQSINKVYDQSHYQTSVYSSTQNRYYQNFYRTYLGNSIPNRNNLMVSATPNLLFDTFMGNRYLIGKDNTLGYEEKLTSKTATLYENKNALPVIYQTEKTMSEEVFDKIPYPYNSSYLLSHVITKNGDSNVPDTTIKEEKIIFHTQDLKEGIIQKTDYGYKINATKKTTFTITTDTDLTEKILFLQFFIRNGQSCDYKDRAITINQSVNKLTCDEWLYANENTTFQYVLAEKGRNNEFHVTIDKGVYEITNLKTHVFEYADFQKSLEGKTAFEFDQKATKGDTISGTLNTTTEGYVVTSIPYDKGFTILVDGKKTDYEMVNKAFVGFKIGKGNHRIKITYQAPWLKEGKILSLLGVLFLGILIIINRKTKREAK